MWIKEREGCCKGGGRSDGGGERYVFRDKQHSKGLKRGQITKGLVSHAMELIFIVSAIAKH